MPREIIKISDIVWDVDKEDDITQLPTSLVISFSELASFRHAACSDAMDMLQFAIDEYLSYKYGYCHAGYSWNFAEEPTPQSHRDGFYNAVGKLIKSLNQTNRDLVLAYLIMLKKEQEKAERNAEKEEK